MYITIANLVTEIKRKKKAKENTRKYSHLSIAQPLIGDKRIIRNKNEICLRQKEFKLSNFIQEFSIEVSIAIALKGLVKRVRQNKSLTVGCIEFDLWSIELPKINFTCKKISMRLILDKYGSLLNVLQGSLHVFYVMFAYNQSNF